MVLRGDVEKLGSNDARNTWKPVDKFILTDDGLLYYVGTSCRKRDEQDEDAKLRLVVPTTMIQRSLAELPRLVRRQISRCSPDVPTGEAELRLIGPARRRAKHVKSCSDCSSSKRRPQLRGYSHGNILAERPFQIVSMGFFIPLPKYRHGHTSILLFQCSFTGFIIAKAMSNISSLMVAQVFGECINHASGHYHSFATTEILAL